MVAVTFDGRIVWGNPLNAQPVLDDNTRQPKLNKNNEPRQRWSFGVAISKHDYQNTPDKNGMTLANALLAAQQEMFPGGVGDFAWKITDGDSIDKNGKSFALRTGYAGCMVLAISSESFPPKFVAHDGTQWADTQDIKCGDYVRAGVDVKPHGGQSPGLYINPTVTGRTGYGEAIISGANADDVLGGPVALPAGASAAPVAAPGMPAAGPTVMPGTGPGTMNPATGAMTPGAATAGVPGMTPAPGAVAPVGLPATPVTPPVAATPAATIAYLTDPASGKQYFIDPATGQAQWAPETPAAPPPPAPAHDFVANAGAVPATPVPAGPPGT